MSSASAEKNRPARSRAAQQLGRTLDRRRYNGSARAWQPHRTKPRGSRPRSGWGAAGPASSPAPSFPQRGKERGEKGRNKTTTTAKLKEISTSGGARNHTRLRLRPQGRGRRRATAPAREKRVGLGGEQGHHCKRNQLKAGKLCRLGNWDPAPLGRQPHRVKGCASSLARPLTRCGRLGPKGLAAKAPAFRCRRAKKRPPGAFCAHKRR